MRHWSGEEIVRKLGGTSAGDAWQAFLERYTSLLVSVIRQYQHEQQRIHDCYLFVCEKLVDDGFRRLRAWRRRDDARFSTWLRATVSNLCIDWHRAEYGRQRPFRTLSDLTDLELRVYQLRFEQARSMRECYETVVAEQPALTELELAGIVRRINRSLTPRQHWLVATRRQATVSIDEVDGRREASLAAGNGRGPEDQLVRDEDQRRLEHAMSQLAPEERLVLKLRYQQGLTFDQVARATGLESAFKARYRIHLALDRIARLLRD